MVTISCDKKVGVMYKNIIIFELNYENRNFPFLCINQIFYCGPLTYYYIFRKLRARPFQNGMNIYDRSKIKEVIAKWTIFTI